MTTSQESYRQIKLKTCSYHIVHVCEHYQLFRVIDGKRNDKTDLTNKNIDAVIRYLSDAEMMHVEEIRSIYEKAETMAA
ncbi:hypothetical protein [Sulfurovum mangrovi]|uniref:hypothetical protein n=1 Tax=Sulfurovum mangrovi TaxID=2893889 RepID=UPI001E389692|nr:hypothetical protein [Sulfurovum mangrovi]UFH59813.1 hypothetical protein LN246_02970 [Sulfurovum mangrovi]UFH59864.1 hypothetical protein LN246_03230 [Sulfurovum mangrovi]UFH60610.1 hypothetical protein LN246_13615 [Sulfurovum mangrovi]